MTTYHVHSHLIDHGLIEASSALDAMRDVMRRAGFVDPQPGREFITTQFKVFREGPLPEITDDMPIDERGAVRLGALKAAVARAQLVLPPGTEINYGWSDLHDKAAVSVWTGCEGAPLLSIDQAGLDAALDSLRDHSTGSLGQPYFSERG